MSLLRLLCVSVLGCALMACMKAYVHPTPDQPHAIVKFRRHYMSTPGEDLKEKLIINDERAYSAYVDSSAGDVARTDALLVHPGMAHIIINVRFTYESTVWTKEKYECGTDDDPRTCTRRVEETVDVTIGGCPNKELGVRFDDGQIYLLQLDHQDSRNCSVRCMIQEPLGHGEFKNRPCVVVHIEQNWLRKYKGYL